MAGNDKPLLMFFYGTLMRGGRNHNTHCAGGTEVSPATVRGLLYALPAGYPALVVPNNTVRATGTTNPARDTAKAHRLATNEPPRPEESLVFGELYAFDDPEERLPALDRLESFLPDDPTSEYRRVLLPASTEKGPTHLAWTYVVDTALGKLLPEGRW